MDIWSASELSDRLRRGAEGNKVGCETGPFPSFQRRGGRAAAGVVIKKSREASLFARVAILILLEITNIVGRQNKRLTNDQQPFLKSVGQEWVCIYRLLNGSQSRRSS